jgi:DNA-binding CsgD family transcriptional regulator
METPVYQQIAARAVQLRELGMTYPEIGKRLGVDRWTVGKAVRWLKR